MTAPAKRRAVIVAGARTPFVRAFGDFTRIDTIGLADEAVRGLLDNTKISSSEIEAIVWGGVILPAGAPNVAREIALDLKLGHGVEGHTVTRACASGLQAITTAAAAIERGEYDVMIAGGSDSTSNAGVNLPQKLIHAAAPLALGKPKPKDYLDAALSLAPFTGLLPRRPKIEERTTGEVMGESADKMAKIHGITRAAQDEFAVRSHHRAAAAIKSGRFDREVVAVGTPDHKTVTRDGLVRENTSVEKLATLKPVFNRDGTVTAGNASPLTDGAAAVLLMSEEKARALGLEPLAAFKSWSYVSVDPADEVLIGPAISMPRALEKAGLSLADVDYVDIHEAFAAQTLSVLEALGSKKWAADRLGRSEAVGTPDIDKVNVHGGSVSIGHPFGATGARMVTTMANELAITGKSIALLGICAAGGHGASAVLERI
ncbi:acetyl-CoA C-acyltransferase [Mycobacterium sp. CBMA271]|uniref:acetyl-CoA C-acyltransferase n=1 Tax=unclassified Mycobacteroides TaxID=2618759 RepID=UPI0012DCD57D|nr:MULTISPECIES: acetyl-CoA C-acyltransferase [unclassified Mycobacteroides]MUM17540.1 acetyl-CoA acetyltransferase [Mycobacteroides sp. CBMA 326]MUM24667.1 acetyl-CoA C-acyltransferase [Mycobacteroides sp. CBMA 271]